MDQPNPSASGKCPIFQCPGIKTTGTFLVAGINYTFSVNDDVS